MGSSWVVEARYVFETTDYGPVSREIVVYRGESLLAALRRVWKHRDAMVVRIEWRPE